MNYILFFLVLLFSALSIQAQFNSSSESGAEIVFNSFEPTKDTLINAGILVSLENGWHIYWKNSGDSGMPTSFEFELPSDFKLQEIKWPIPKIFEFEGYASYGYEDKVLFPFQIIIPRTKSYQSLEISVKIKSLICKDVCKPFNTEIRKVFDLNSAFSPSTEIKELFRNTLSQLPQKDDLIEIEARESLDKILIKINSQRLNLNRIINVHFIPFENGIFKNSLNQNYTKKNNSIELLVEYDQFKTNTPEIIQGILIFEVLSEDRNKKFGYEINERLQLINNQ